MNDKGEVVDLKNSKKLLEDIPNKIMSSMGIVCKISLKTKQKLGYILIAVKKSVDPVFYHGGMYIRREAIYNALIHSDYSNTNDIQIKIMDDELFIGNNCLIDTSKINDKNILTINKSIPLNPIIADTFYRARFIEHWGRGIKRICDECKDNGMKMPRFEIVSTDFAVIFKANYKYDYGNIDDQGNTTQKTTQKKVK